MAKFRKTKKSQPLTRVPKKERADVLLIYPIWVLGGGRGRLQRMLPPLGVLSIASYLEFKGYDVHVVDLHAEQLTPDDFRTILRTLRPRFVGVTVLSSHFIPANYVFKICKEEVPDCRVFAGGVHAEAFPEQMLRNPFLDAVGRGDGEETMLELASGVPYADIPGLSFRGQEGQVVHNKPRAVEMNLDRYPFPAYHLINLDNYFPPVGTYRDLPAVNLLMTRGCPGKCTFCNSAKTTLRSRSSERMIELIKKLRYDEGIRQFTFYDDTFTANPRTVKEFCQGIIEQKVDIKFTCYARGDMFNETMADLLSRAGCHHVLLGIESGSPTLMAKIGKPIEKEKYAKVVKIAHQHGIEVRGAFIIGHLEETPKTLEETLQFAIDLDLDFFQPSIMTPYPGTQLYIEAKRDGLLLHEKYELYGLGGIILKMKNLSPEDLMKFYERSFIRFYLRPSAVWKQLKRLRYWAQLKDLIKTFYIIFIEGLQKDKSDQMRGWLDFDPELIVDHKIIVPNTPRLTYEVRQSGEFAG